jgi:hypothetical protein
MNRENFARIQDGFTADEAQEEVEENLRNEEGLKRERKASQFKLRKIPSRASTISSE